MMNIDTFIQRFGAGLAELDDLPPTAARRRYETLCNDFAPPDPSGMQVTDTRLGDVAVRRFQPRTASPGQAVFVHGGGWNLGSVISHHGIAASLAEQLAREVVSVDYRLAPEADYRAALEDCQRVVDAVDPLTLVGDSAGARLAMDVALSRPRQGPLGLVYPPVGRPSAATLGPDAPLLSRDDVLTSWRQVADTMPESDVDLPPAASIEVLAVEHDPLTAPLEAAVTAWRQAGADVGYHRAEGMVHGALHAQSSLAAMGKAWRDFCQALNRRLGD